MRASYRGALAIFGLCGSSAGCGRDFTLIEHHPIRFDHGVHGKCRAAFALAPSAVAAVHDQRIGQHVICRRAACTSS